MKKSLTLLLIVCGFYCNAQDYIETIPTRFDTFINRSSIEWASYANDSIRFTHPNLSAILVKRMEKGQIKTVIPLASGTPQANMLHYSSKEENKGRFYPLCSLPMYDSLGNVIGGNVERKDPPSGIDSLSFNLIFATQILYVEGGRLKSYIPWVTPAFSVCTSTGQFVFFGWYFSTCINFSSNLVSPPGNQLLFLGETKQKIKIDTVDRVNMLKQLYGKNLVETIWPYILKGKFDIYSVATSKKIEPQKIDNFIVSNDSINRYVYDSLGNIESEKYYDANPIPSSITDVQVLQKWYYDNKRNLVFCKITELLLCARGWNNGVQEKEVTPILKIVFN